MDTEEFISYHVGESSSCSHGITGPPMGPYSTILINLLNFCVSTPPHSGVAHNTRWFVLS